MTDKTLPRCLAHPLGGLTTGQVAALTIDELRLFPPLSWVVRSLRDAHEVLNCYMPVEQRELTLWAETPADNKEWPYGRNE